MEEKKRKKKNEKKFHEIETNSTIDDGLFWKTL